MRLPNDVIAVAQPLNCIYSIKHPFDKPIKAKFMHYCVFSFNQKILIADQLLYETRRDKTEFLPMQKQKRRSVSQLLLFSLLA